MKKMRLLLVVCASFFLPTIVLAGGPAAPAPETWTSFYAGLGLGSEMMQADENTASISSGTFAAFPYTATNIQTANMQANSVLGHFGLGFAVAKNAYFLGIEPYLEVSELNASSNTNGPITLTPAPTIGLPTVLNQTQLNLSTLSGGVDLKPGLSITPQLNVFAIIGGDIRRLKVTSTATPVDLAGTALTGPQSTTSSSSTEFAARFGFGVQSWVNEHIALYFNFVHNFYPNIAATLNTVGGPGATLTSAAISHLGSNVMLLGANYYLKAFNPSNAWMMAPTNVVWDGFFAGAATGAIVNQNLENTNFTINATAFGQAQSELDTGTVGSQTSLFVGYGRAFNRFYVALRGFASWADRNADGKNLDTTLTIPALPATIAINHAANIRMREIEWGADLMPGFLITPQTLIHVTVGFAGNKADLYSNTGYTTGSVVGGASAQSEGSVSKSLYGLRLGIGFQQAITNRVRVTADYVYTDYGTISLTDQAANALVLAGLNGSVLNSTSFDLHSQAVMFGILVQL